MKTREKLRTAWSESWGKNMRRWFRRPAAPQVQSVFVQANYFVSPFSLTRGQTLVRHLLSRF